MSAIQISQQKKIAKELRYSLASCDNDDVKEFIEKTKNTALENTRNQLVEIMKTEGNAVCCDCGGQRPVWAVVNLGIFVCIQCSGIHRKMGVHISKVRSVTMDIFDVNQLEVFFSLSFKTLKNYISQNNNTVHEGDWEHCFQQGLPQELSK